MDRFIKGNLPSLGPGESGGPGSAAGVFDGIDLDWEWPGSEGNAGNIIRPEDKANFTLLVAEFRRAARRVRARRPGSRYELSAFLPAAPAKIDAGFEARKIFRYLDFATVQGYDFHGTWESVTNHQSAMRVPAGAPVTPDFSIDSHREGVADARGARGTSSSSASRTTARAGPGSPAAATGCSSRRPARRRARGGRQRGLQGARNADRHGFTVHRDLRAGHAWLFDGTTFWTYDDPLVVLQKALYIRLQGLGGAMVWELSGDDANATLTRTIHFGLTAHASATHGRGSVRSTGVACRELGSVAAEAEGRPASEVVRTG